MPDAYSFTPLIQGTSQSVVIAGTGLSTPDAPTIDKLKEKLQEIADGLALTPSVDLDDPDFFYVTAELILIALIADGRTDDESRLWLAVELGMLDDSNWFIPLKGNTRRHRALARLAVEQRLRAIISLNWDTLMEVALESLGLTEGSTPPRPWDVTRYARAVDDFHMPQLGNNDVFPVIKPHGCVRELESARSEVRSGRPCPQLTFKLTKSDLTNQDYQKQIDKAVETYIAQCPLVAIGWKASEEYLRTAVIRAATDVQKTSVDFSLISRSWYPSDDKPETYHDEIARAYNTDRAHSFFHVGDATALDCFLQWVQAQYALELLIGATPNSESDTIRKLLANLKSACSENPLLKWVDNWLPAWVRMCWRTGVMRGVDPHTTRPIAPSEIPLIPRDVHIPFGGMSTERKDLVAAAKLLTILGDDLNRFEYETFPGCLWDSRRKGVYIPLPGWEADNPRSDLGALKPFIEALPLQYAEGIHLLLLDAVGQPPEMIEGIQMKLQALVSSLVPLAAFADASTITWVDLQTLSGGSNASMD
jgi:hypothetical protein